MTHSMLLCRLEWRSLSMAPINRHYCRESGALCWAANLTVKETLLALTAQLQCHMGVTHIGSVVCKRILTYQWFWMVTSRENSHEWCEFYGEAGSTVCCWPFLGFSCFSNNFPFIVSTVSTSVCCSNPFKGPWAKFCRRKPCHSESFTCSTSTCKCKVNNKL